MKTNAEARAAEEKRKREIDWPDFRERFADAMEVMDASEPPFSPADIQERKARLKRWDAEDAAFEKSLART